MSAARLLVVEDEIVLAEVMRLQLEKLGYGVVGYAASGPEALHLTALHKPDLVLMDIRLNGPMDGIEAAQLIDEQFDIPSVYLSGYNDQQTFETLKRRAPHSYLEKPVQARALYNAIEITLHQHRLQRQVREREQWLNAVLRSGGEAVLTTDAEGRITFLNPAAEVLTGWPSAEAVGQPWHHCLTFAPPPVADVVTEALTTRPPVVISHQQALTRRNGETLLVEYTLAPITNAFQQAVGVVCNVRDVTTREQTHTALVASEQRYRALFEQMAVGLIQMDWATGQLHEANQRFCDLVGLPLITLCQRTLLDLTHPVDAPSLAAQFERLRQQAIPAFTLEHRLQRADGGWGWVLLTISPVGTAQGLTHTALGVVQDLTAQKASEAARHESENRYQAVIATMEEGVVVHAQDGSILACNPSAQRILGLTEDQILGRTSLHPAWHAVHEDGSPFPGSDHPIMHTLRTGEPQSGVLMGVAKPGDELTWISITTRRLPPTDPPTPTLAVATFADITQRKQADDALLTLLKSTAVSGEPFFHSLVRELAATLRVRCALVGELVTPNRVRTVALWANGQLSANLEYDLADTPCELVVGRTLCHYPRAVQTHFPNDPLLGTMQAESYMGVPLFDPTGQALGLVAVLHDAPLPEQNLAQSLLTLFAARAASELERLRAAAAAQQAQQRFQELVNSLDGIVWEADATSLQFTFVSQQAERLLGYPASAWLAQPNFWVNHIHPADREAVLNFCLASTQALKDHAFEYRMLRADDTILWLRDVVTVVVRPDQPVMLRGMMVDITAMKQAEQALRLSEERYRMVSNLISDFAYRLEAVPDTAEVRREWVMGGFTAMTGYAEADTTSMAALVQLVYPPDRPLFTAHVRQLLAGQNRVSEYRLITRGGQVRWVRDYGAPEWDSAAQRVTHIHGAVQDITERKGVEDALRASEARQRALLNAIPDLMFRLSLTGQYLDYHANDPADLVAPADRFIGHQMQETLPPDLAAQMLQCLQQVRATGQMQLLEYELDTIGRGRQTFEARMVNGGAEEVVVIVRNITEAKRLAEERVNFERQLLETQKLESLGLLAGGIAHDLNNLLVPILGNAGLIRLNLVPDTPASQAVQHIETAAQRASDLVRQMLAYAGKGRMLTQVLQLNQLLQETAELLQSSISKNAQLTLTLAPDLPTVEGDATQLRQVIMNLLTNASDALRDQPGQIVARTSVVARAAIDATALYPLTAVPATHYVLLEVTDTGQGMAPATLARIFEPFFTTKTTGRGLGLSAVLGIVRSHQGALAVQSAVGQGTTFRIWLPAQTTPAPAHPALAAPPANAPATWRGHGTILLVDDEPAVRQTSQRLLQHFGFEVLAVADGTAALAALEAQAPNLVGVMLDLTMPGLSGEETLTALHARAPQLPVLLMSGYDDKHLTLATGVAFLAKPFTPQQLQAAWQQLLCPQDQN